MSRDPAGLARTYLYVPATAGDRLARASSRGADAVIADLEDSVAPSRRSEALDAAAAWLRKGSGRCESWVRLNPGERGLEEAERLAPLRPHGLVLAKCGSAQDVERVASLLDEVQAPGTAGTVLMPLVETATAFWDVLGIAAARRVLRLQIGELDLAADMGVAPDDEASGLPTVRAQVVLASAAARILPPVGAVTPDFRDPGGLRRSTLSQKRAGFVGRALIHPDQIPTVHDVYEVSEREREQAQRVVDAYDAALASGSGVVVDGDGRMVDEAVVRTSRRALALAAAAGRTSG